MCYFLLFLCPRIVIITYNHVPMQMLFMLGNSSLCVKIRINSKTESKEILEKKEWQGKHWLLKTTIHCH